MGITSLWQSEFSAHASNMLNDLREASEASVYLRYREGGDALEGFG